MMDEQQELVELEVWFALRRLDDAFERLSSAVGSQPRRPELRVDYAKARAALAAPIVSLRAALERALPEPRALPGESYAERIFAALLIHYDERELAQSSGFSGAGAAELLQTEYAQLYDGGEQFFVFLERALRAPAPPNLVLQLFLFCLRARFCGRYPNLADPERLAYQDELSRRVGKRPSEASDASLAPAPLERIEGANFPHLLYVSGVVALVLVWFGLNSVADAHQSARTGLKECVGR
jgi:type VI protein secretion system component VasF